MRTGFKLALFLLFAVCFIVEVNAQQNQKLPYKDSTLKSEIRADDLLSRMSNEDKILQLMEVLDGTTIRFNNEFFNDDAKMQQAFGKGVHSVQPSFEGAKETVESKNRIQKYLL
jgi:hypothetical protein